MRAATNEKAEGEKILRVKQAEGEAEARYLSGVGVARQRQAIVDGLQESVLAFANNVPGTSPKEVMDMVLVTQYFDTLKEIGSNSRNTAVFIPHGPGAVRDIAEQIRNGLLQGDVAGIAQHGWWGSVTALLDIHLHSSSWLGGLWGNPIFPKVPLPPFLRADLVEILANLVSETNSKPWWRFGTCDWEIIWASTSWLWSQKDWRELGRPYISDYLVHKTACNSMMLGFNDGQNSNSEAAIRRFTGSSNHQNVQARRLLKVSELQGGVQHRNRSMTLLLGISWDQGLFWKILQRFCMWFLITSSHTSKKSQGNKLWIVTLEDWTVDLHGHSWKEQHAKTSCWVVMGVVLCCLSRTTLVENSGRDQQWHNDVLTRAVRFSLR